MSTTLHLRTLRANAVHGLLTGPDPAGWADTLEELRALRDLAGWAVESIDQAAADLVADGRLRLTFDPDGTTHLAAAPRQEVGA